MMQEQPARNKVIVAMDESRESEFALKCYLKHAQRPDDEVTLLYVPDWSNMFRSYTAVAVHDPTLINQILQNERDKRKTAVEKITALHSSCKVPNATIKTDQPGKAGQVICELAERQKVRLIVVGAHEKNILERAVLGSCSDYVVHHANVPVLVCRMPKSS